VRKINLFLSRIAWAGDLNWGRIETGINLRRFEHSPCDWPIAVITIGRMVSTVHSNERETENRFSLLCGLVGTFIQVSKVFERAEVQSSRREKAGSTLARVWQKGGGRPRRHQSWMNWSVSSGNEAAD
jgi:hypothetical protein